MSECADTIRMQHFVVLNVAVKMKKKCVCVHVCVFACTCLCVCVCARVYGGEEGGCRCLILEFECGCKLKMRKLK